DVGVPAQPWVHRGGQRVEVASLREVVRLDQVPEQGGRAVDHLVLVVQGPSTRPLYSNGRWPLRRQMRWLPSSLYTGTLGGLPWRCSLLSPSSARLRATSLHALPSSLLLRPSSARLRSPR